MQYDGNISYPINIGIRTFDIHSLPTWAPFWVVVLPWWQMYPTCVFDVLLFFVEQCNTTFTLCLIIGLIHIVPFDNHNFLWQSFLSILAMQVKKFTIVKLLCEALMNLTCLDHVFDERRQYPILSHVNTPPWFNGIRCMGDLHVSYIAMDSLNYTFLIFHWGNQQIRTSFQAYSIAITTFIIAN